MLTRRMFLRTGLEAGAAALVSAGYASRVSPPAGIAVNDIHSKLNPARVARLIRPASVETVQRAVEAARAEGGAISIAGGRHAMGGQQFGQDTTLIDMRSMNRVLRFDSGAGLLQVEGGIEWPELIGYLVSAQKGRTPSWGIVQKQTGADRLTIGGALAANAHGSGFVYRPIIQDVEAFTLVDARGSLLQCGRRENAELFGDHHPPSGTSLLKKHGFRQVGYWLNRISGNDHQLIYMLAWESLDERVSKFDTFAKDPERVRVFAESEKNGPVVEQVTTTILRPTAFSPMK
jgi:hypothetical protein